MQKNNSDITSVCKFGKHKTESCECSTDINEKCMPVPETNSCHLKSYVEAIHRVTNTESRFPAVRVLRLGREFYRGKYGMTGSSHVWFPDLGDKLDDFGAEIWLKGAGIISISLLGEDIRLNVLDDSM
ncbi:hypothetical protein AVEN_66532-1 [Araneus ventricosus]|uniref:Uncharacterized protein n=1 Tax=Araneus ventricosus TaxID=182803 RepID=A0A4Y2EC02_ARAVE|nr:hypothetical protein AVEN_66532-1 [Araneus ventricosus]